MTEPTGTTPPAEPAPQPPRSTPLDAGSAGTPAVAKVTSDIPAPIDTGPDPGVAYADLVPRIVAIVIDVLIIGIVYAVVVAVLAALGGWGAFLIGGVIYLALSVGYFVYTWTRQRATLGQLVLGLETVNAADGASLTQDQALRRWVFLWGPGALAQVFGYGGGTVVGLVGWLVALLALLYELYLLYTTSQSPRRQGFHDVQAATVVVKRAR
jgi:uncharacterized RDD family membrane protein YckC